MNNNRTGATEVLQEAAPSRPTCEIPGCTDRARYRGTCSPDHHRERALRRQAALRGFKLDDSGATHADAEWEVVRSKALTSLRLLRQSLDNLERGLAADRTAFEDRTPYEWGRLVAENLAHEAEELRKAMIDPVGTDVIESARVEMNGRRALAEIHAASQTGGA